MLCAIFCLFFHFFLYVYLYLKILSFVFVVQKIVFVCVISVILQFHLYLLDPPSFELCTIFASDSKFSTCLSFQDTAKTTTLRIQFNKIHTYSESLPECFSSVLSEMSCISAEVVVFFGLMMRCWGKERKCWNSEKKFFWNATWEKPIVHLLGKICCLR